MSSQLVLNLSTKELIVAAIIIPLEISKGVASRGLCQLAELSVILPAFRWSGQSGLGRTDFRPLISDSLRKQLTPRLPTCTACWRQQERVLPVPPTGPRHKNVAMRRTQTRAPLSVA
jgi:hypothetical protein